MPVYYVGEPGEGLKLAAEAVRQHLQAREGGVWVVEYWPEDDGTPPIDKREPARKDRQWMTKAMLAAHFGVCLSTIDNWRRKSGLPEHRIGKVLRFDLLEVEAWVTKRDAS